MVKKEIKKLQSWEEVNSVMFKLALSLLAVRKKENQLNEEVKAIQKKYSDELQSTLKQIKEYEEQIKHYCDCNKIEFGKARSKKLIFGIVKYIKGKAALKPLSKKYTWEWITEKFSLMFSSKYVKMEPVLSKTKVIEAYDQKKLTDEQLEMCGCKITSTERFHYDIDWTKIKTEDSK